MIALNFKLRRPYTTGWFLVQPCVLTIKWIAGQGLTLFKV